MMYCRGWGTLNLLSHSLSCTLKAVEPFQCCRKHLVKRVHWAGPADKKGANSQSFSAVRSGKGKRTVKYTVSTRHRHSNMRTQRLPCHSRFYRITPVYMVETSLKARRIHTQYVELLRRGCRPLELTRSLSWHVEGIRRAAYRWT